MRRTRRVATSAILAGAAAFAGSTHPVWAALKPVSPADEGKVGMSWIMLAVFVIAALAIAFMNSKRR